MELRAYWSVIGVTILVTAVVLTMPGIKRRFLVSCVVWALCGLFVYLVAQDPALVAVPGLALIALTVLKLVQPDR
jgi:hypothetical protein